MNWFRKFMGRVSRLPNKILGVTAVIGGAAAAVAALGPLGLPVEIVAIALKVAAYSGTVAVVAAKALPGDGENRNYAGPGQVVDKETPKAPR